MRAYSVATRCRVVPVRRLKAPPSSAGRGMDGPPTLQQRRPVLVQRRWQSSAVPPPPPPSTGAGAGGGGLTLKAGAVGVLAGVFGSLVGMGGAFVMIPALTAFLRASQHQAHGTSLAAVMSTGSGGALSYGLEGHVDWEAAGYVALLGMVSARAGARTTSTLSSSTLKKLQGVFQLVIAPTVPFRDEILALFKGEPSSSPKPQEDAKAKGEGFEGEWGRRAQLGAIGLGAGFLSGLFGVGGGSVVVPALTVCMADMTHYRALGTSLAAMVPTAIVGTYTHYTHGNVLSHLVLPLALGSAAGSFLGSKYLALQLPEKELKWGFFAMMLLLGGNTLRQGIVMGKTLHAAAKNIK